MFYCGLNEQYINIKALYDTYVFELFPDVVFEFDDNEFPYADFAFLLHKHTYFMKVVAHSTVHRNDLLTPGSIYAIEALYGLELKTPEDKALFCLFHEIGHYLDCLEKGPEEFLATRSPLYGTSLSSMQYRLIPEEVIADEFAIKQLLKLKEKELVCV